MLKGKAITLRPVEEDDLSVLYEYILDVENRGEFYPRGIDTQTDLRKQYEEHGAWKDDTGTLVIVDNKSNKVVGTIVWFKTVDYLTELEIGYIMYDTSSRSKGGMTEAVKLLTGYLFDTKQFNRIRSASPPRTDPRGAWPRRAATSTKAPSGAPGGTAAATTIWSYTPSPATT